MRPRRDEIAEGAGAAPPRGKTDGGFAAEAECLSSVAEAACSQASPRGVVPVAVRTARARALRNGPTATAIRFATAGRRVGVSRHF